MLISLILRFSSPRSRATLSTNDLAGFSVWKTWRPLARAAVKSSITGLMLNVAAHSTHEQQPVVRGQTQSPSSACPPLNKACNLAICATHSGRSSGELAAGTRDAFIMVPFPFYLKGAGRKELSENSGALWEFWSTFHNGMALSHSGKTMRVLGCNKLSWMQVEL